MAISRMGNAIYVLISNEVWDTDEDALRVRKIVTFANTYPGVHNTQLKTMEHKNYTRLNMRGTHKAMRAMQTIIDISGLEMPENSDHDHDVCIANARALGVPASWAHTPETYLSM